MPLDHLGAGGERGDLLLLLYLPVDVGFDVGVVDVDHHHFRRAPGGAARLDRARRAVADLEEGHQARGAAAAGKLLVLAAKGREVRAGAGAVLEEARLAHPQVHDAALVDKVVADRLDEAGVRLGMLVGRLGLDELAGLEVDVIVALARPVDAIGPVEAGIEPLRGVGRGDLARQHEAHLVVIGAGVLVAVEHAGLPAPIGPGAGEPIEHLLRRGFRAGPLGLGQRLERLLVGDRSPQEGRDVHFLDPLQPRGHARLAEIFLREHVGGHLAPGGRNLDPVEREDDRPVGIANLAPCHGEGDPVVGRSARLGEVPLDSHRSRPLDLVANRPPAPRSLPLVSNAERIPAFLNPGSVQARASRRRRARPALARLAVTDASGGSATPRSRPLAREKAHSRSRRKRRSAPCSGTTRTYDSALRTSTPCDASLHRTLHIVDKSG